MSKETTSKYAQPGLWEPDSPQREADCPARFVCAMLNNEREACAVGGPALTAEIPNEACLASIVLLLAKSLGLPTGPKEAYRRINDLPDDMPESQTPAPAEPAAPAAEKSPAGKSPAEKAPAEKAPEPDKGKGI